MTKKTQAERTSAKALSRFAAVATVLLTLCLVFMMPVSAAEYAAGTDAALTDAFEKAADGDTVKLTADITTETPFTIEKSITFDLGGHTLTNTFVRTGVNAETELAVSVTANGVTVQNGKIVTTGGCAGIQANGPKASLVLKDNMEIEQNGRLEGDLHNSFAVAARSGALVTIEDGTYSSDYYTAQAKAKSTLIIHDKSSIVNNKS